jgi:glucose/arabinose dehydrogenase
VQGIWENGDSATKISHNPQDSLLDIDGKGRYSTPEFIWNVPVGVTALKFLDSDKLGTKYENDLFVANIHKGNIYHFDWNKERTGLILEGSLADKVANYNEDSPLVFASGFNGITDMEVGPDGYLYVLSFHDVTRGDRHHYYGTGGIYRIIPSDYEKPQ